MKFNNRFNSASLSRSFGTRFFMAALVLLFAASCKKESDIGLDVQPDSDVIGLATTDTMTLLTYTIADDSARSDEQAIVQIGYLNDPEFGKTTAGLFTQFSVPNNLTSIDFGTAPTLDSAFITLTYDADYYGDTMSSQTFNVYQMTEDLYKDSAYYSNHKKSFYSAPVGSLNFTPAPRKPINRANDTVPAYLRIPINTAWAQNILNQSPIADNAAFLNYVKGFYIAADSGSSSTGALLRFRPLDSLSRFTVYYHNTADTANFSFVVNSTTAYYNYFDHNYGSAGNTSLTNQLLNHGVNTSDYVFVQGAAGVQTKIEFPYLNALKAMGPVAINKAELIIKADPTTITPFFPANKQLFPLSLDSAGVLYLLPDYFENSVYFGGEITTSNEYHINIARYLQHVVDGDAEDHGLLLKELDPARYGRRVILGSSNGGAGNPYRMYLHLVYTKIN